MHLEKQQQRGGAMQYIIFLMMLLLMGESHASNIFEPVANDISIQAFDGFIFWTHA